MAPLLALFLAALMGLPLAQALDCHVCAYNGENCFNPMRCPSMVTYCMTTRIYASTTACCQYDLCNGAGRATPGALALALAPVLLAALRGLL
uniref:Ly6/neurotoxin 1 n=1 Tax=Molossus molossus TaxID=27622 RepID=A0A7J8BC11_MOLMO|nr:Ly6/neurotoxin 1 [Molossus molossus]